MSELPRLQAVISGSASAPALQTPGQCLASRLATYELALAGKSAGNIDFQLATGAESYREATAAGHEVVEIDDSCLARLLATAARRLAASTEPSAGIEEPAFDNPSGHRSAGIVLIDEAGQLTIREPANHFAGYDHSYPKGRLDRGEAPQEAARRELTEETGLTGRIVGLIGDFAGQMGITRFYLGIRTGGTETLSAETWAVKTVTPLVALSLLNVQRDKDVLYRLVELAAALTDWTWTIAGHPMRCHLRAGRVLCDPDT